MWFNWKQQERQQNCQADSAQKRDGCSNELLDSQPELHEQDMSILVGVEFLWPSNAGFCHSSGAGSMAMRPGEEMKTVIFGDLVFGAFRLAVELVLKA